MSETTVKVLAFLIAAFIIYGAVHLMFVMDKLGL